jgi:hypothetical protein
VGVDSAAQDTININRNWIAATQRTAQ